MCEEYISHASMLNAACPHETCIPSSYVEAAYRHASVHALGYADGQIGRQADRWVGIGTGWRGQDGRDRIDWMGRNGMDVTVVDGGRQVLARGRV